jgi:hypothetical protein
MPPTVQRFWFKQDANTGAGYGTLKKKFSGGTITTVGTFPYFDDGTEDEEDDDLSNLMTSKLVSNKTGYTDVARDRPHKRADRASFTKMRWNITETAAMKGMVPFPFKVIYGKFDGPSVGGASTNQSFTNAPGRLVGTQYGTTRANKLSDDSLITIDRLNDLMDPDTRNLVKQRLKVNLVKDI